MRTLLAAMLTALLSTAAVAADVKSVEADATQFKVTMSDGRVLRSHDLIGARLVMRLGGRQVRVRIDAIERDPNVKTAEVWLHSFSVQAADGAWQPFCMPGPDGRQEGFPVAGRPDRSGAIQPDAPGVFEMVCTSGARGKCIRFGYLPWLGAATRDQYNACVRMVRADYCGQGEATTKDGMRIDVYDDRRIQVADNDPKQDFEAGWTVGGAVCVRHVRVKENTALEKLVQACPRLKDRVGAMCTEETARALGATLFNRSNP